MPPSLPDNRRGVDSAAEGSRDLSQLASVFPRTTPEGDRVDPEPRAGRQLLVEVNTALTRALDVEAGLGEILALLTRRSRLAEARVYRVRAEDRRLTCVATAGGCSPDGWMFNPDDSEVVAWTARKGEAVYVPEAGKDPRCLAAGACLRSEYAVPLRSGSELVGVLHVASQDPGGIRATTRKLVDQVAAQAALALERNELRRQLRRSEERFRSIFEQGCFGVALVRLDGRISSANPAFAQLLGYEPEELQDRQIADLLHPDDRAESFERVRALRAGQTPRLHLEKRCLCKAGEVMWFSAAVSLVRPRREEDAYFLLMVQDIGERKRAQEDRARLQQQLYQAQKMEAVGTLAGGIAHDFNNLLSVILGFATLVRQRREVDDPLQESMRMIEESAERAAELTRQLLGFARPEKQQLRSVQVEEAMDRVARIAGRTFDRRIKLSRKKPKRPLWVEAEPSYLEQAILNLCLNARDAMPHGGTLTLSSSQVTVESGDPVKPADLPPGRFVAITVHDTGMGIEPGAMQRIFEPFFTSKKARGGTGLGLAIVYGFVKNHGGFVHVESEPGKGAEFTLYLPAISPQKAPVRPNPPCLEKGSGTVLVVDDEPLVRAFAEQGLQGLGYRVLAAENGAQALAIYEQHAQEIDCVLLDLMMPDISGIETFRRMRGVNPQVRVIFASGFSTGSLLGEAPEAASAEFLGKPYTLEALSKAVGKACRGKGGA